MSMPVMPWSTIARPARSSVSKSSAGTSRRYNNCNWNCDSYSRP